MQEYGVTVFELLIIMTLLVELGLDFKSKAFISNPNLSNISKV